MPLGKIKEETKGDGGEGSDKKEAPLWESFKARPLNDITEAYDKGQLTDSDMKSISDFRKKSDQSKTIIPKEPIFSSQNEKSRNIIIRKFLNNGDLLPSKTLIKSLQNNEIGIEEALNFSKIYRNKTVLQQDPTTPEGAKNLVKSFKDTGQSVMEYYEKEFEPANSITDMSLSEVGSIAAEGALFGAYDSGYRPQSYSQAAAYLGISLLSSISTGMGVGALLRGAFTATKVGLATRKYMSGLKNIAELSTDVKKVKNAKRTLGALKLTGAVAENTVIGFGAGTAKGVIKKARGEDIDPIEEAILEAGFAAIATPVLTGAFKGVGAVVSKIKPGRTSVFASRVGSSIEADSLIQEYAKSGAVKNFSEKLISKGDAGKLQEGTEIFNTYKALKRFKAVEPFVGSIEQIKKIPQVLLASLDSDAEKAASKLFLDPEAPLKSIYQSDEALRALVENKKFSQALDYLNVKADEIVRNVDFKDYASSQYSIGADTISKFQEYAVDNMISGKSAYSKMPGLKNAILGYMENPTPENANFLVSIKTVGREKGEISKFGKKGLSRIDVLRSGQNIITNRISWDQADDISKNIVKNWYGAISDSIIPSEAFGKFSGKIKDSEDVLRAASFINRDFQRGMIESFARQTDLDSMTGLIDDPKEIESIDQAIKVRTAIEFRKLNLQKRQSLGLLLKDFSENPPVTDEAKLDLDSKKKLITTLNQRINSLDSYIKDMVNKIRSINPDDAEHFQKIMKKVSDIYDPNLKTFTTGEGAGKMFLNRSDFSITQDGKLYEGDILSRKLINERYDFSKNPTYIKERSSIADALQAMLVSGYDVREMNLGTNWGGILSFEKVMRREFGPNNPIQRAFIDPLKDIQIKIKVDTDKYMRKIRSIGFRPGSSESGLLMDFSEGKISRESSDFLKLSPQMQDKIIEGEKVLRSIYDDLLGRVNYKMSQLGLPMIKARSDYVSHIADVQSFMQSVLKQVGNSFTKRIDDGSISELDWADQLSDVKGIARLSKGPKSDPNRTFSFFELQRKGGSGYKRDAIGALEAYLNPSLKRIHMSEMVRNIDFARNFAPKNLKDHLQYLKEVHLLGLGQKKFLGGDLSGNQVKFLTWLRHKIADSTIPLSASTALANVLSVGGNIAVSAKSGLKALGTMFSKSGEDVFNSSRIILTRSEPEFDKADFNTFVQFAKKATVIFDKFAAKHAVMTGYEYGIEQGLAHKQAVKFADYYAGMLQAGTTSVERPGIYDTVVGRSLAQFQTYSLNFFTSIASDLPQIAKNEGAVKAASMMVKFLAGASVSNEIASTMGMPDIYDMEAFVPGLMSYKYGGPTAAKLVWGTISDLQDKKPEKSLKSIGENIGSLAIPAGKPLLRAAKEVFNEKGGTTSERIKRGVFGKYLTEQAAKERKKDIKARDNPGDVPWINIKRKSRKFIRKGLGR